VKLGSALDIWHLFNSWSDGAIFCFTFHMFEIRSFSNHMRKIGQINLRCTHIAKLFIWLKPVRWPVSCCCFEKFQQQHGLRDVHKILNNSIDILVSYFLWTPLRCPERSMRASGNELFHAPYNAAFQTNLDPMWMCGGFRENILDDAFRKFSGSLILFL